MNELFTTRLFDLEKDRDVINSWCEQRDLTPLQEELITPYGIIVESDSKPVSVIWMYPVHGSKVCFIDNLISDPDAKKSDRNLALDIMFTAVHGTARDMGFKVIKLITNNLTVQSRIKRYGYISDSKTDYLNFIGVL